MSGEESNSTEGEKKQVTIKGIDSELYERAVQLSREMGITIGELVNKSLKTFMSAADVANKAFSTATQALTESGRALVEGIKGTRVISNIDELTVSRIDLENEELPVAFKGIKKLVFTDDIDWELFNSKVSSIIMCDEVTLPKTIPKLKALEKMRFVKRVIVPSTH